MHDGASGFATYLRSAILAAGFASPTQLARAARLDPSVVLRWLAGSQRPTVRSLEKVAPLLGRSTAEMVRAAYPDRLRDSRPSGSMHELAYMVDRLLGSNSTLPPRDRDALEQVLRHIIDSYPRNGRQRRGYGRSVRAGRGAEPGRSEARPA